MNKAEVVQHLQWVQGILEQDRLLPRSWKPGDDVPTLAKGSVQVHYHRESVIAAQKHLKLALRELGQ